MSNWSSYQFTRKGEQLRAKVEAGKCKLTLTKIKIGNGNVTLGDIKDMSDLKSPQLVLGISSCAVSAEDDRVCEVVGIASSSNVENAFSVTEMGLYANDPDVGEILYLVEIDTSPDDMPNKNAQSPVTLTYQIELVTSNTANVTVMASPAGLVTVKMMSAHRTAAELDHPDKSVHKKHLHQDAYESPALTGTPTAPTANKGTNTQQIANTAFVASGLADKFDKTGGVINPALITDEGYTEGIRIATAPNNWSLFILGCKPNTREGNQTKTGGWGFFRTPANELIIGNRDCMADNAAVVFGLTKRPISGRRFMHSIFLRIPVVMQRMSLLRQETAGCTSKNGAAAGT